MKRNHKSTRRKLVTIHTIMWGKNSIINSDNLKDKYFKHQKKENKV